MTIPRNLHISGIRKIIHFLPTRIQRKVDTCFPAEEEWLRPEETKIFERESKILFSRHPSVPLMQALASATFEAGMKPLSQRNRVSFLERTPPKRNQRTIS